MRFSIILLLSLAFTFTAFGQDSPDSGFTNKAEAKNLLRDTMKEGKWLEYWESYKFDYKIDTEKSSITTNSTLHYNNGDISTIDDYKNGLHIHGSWKNSYRYTTDTNADNYFLTIYKHGKPSGIVREYSKNGSLVATIPYKNGKKNGMRKSYYENGTISGELPYANGKINGVAKLYYPNGVLNWQASYTNGLEDGIAKEYYDNGKVKSETIYNKGVKGITKYYNENGNKTK
ncbi:MAG TPA: toxin-antitoxin system YwqK family antitoxin [Bacteroidia bacterium]|jgi:antitoxin component YwqK of YwqJK toxin-antitoxin module|nr:toxin-antitoxin system YwqK family antitoxin [Bacteroidia bacterium]